MELLLIYYVLVKQWQMVPVICSCRIKNYGLMEEIFFSSTFGGDNVALAASLATINKIEKNKVIYKTKNYGDKLIKELNNVCIKEEYINILNNYYKLVA